MSANGTSTAVTKVGWVGPKPAWLESEDLSGAVLVGDISKADVIHFAGSAAELPKVQRRLQPRARVVIQLPAHLRLGALDVRRLNSADIVLVESSMDLPTVRRRLPRADVRLLRQPIDLDWYAPEPKLLDTPLRGRDLRRFRRFHRLAPPVILFAGPYTPDGGLDDTLEAVIALRKEVPEARLAAIPEGAVEIRYRDGIERRALALGHHATVEWEVSEDERPFWYACADVTCSPGRTPGSAVPPTYAAAAGRPFVGTDLGTVPQGLGNDKTGYFVPPNDVTTLQAALLALVADVDEAHRLGDEARRWAERSLTPAAVLADLVHLWHGVATDTPATAPDSAAREVGLVTR